MGILRHSEFLSVALLEILFFVVNIHTGIGEVALKLYICDRIFLFKIRKNAKNAKKCKKLFKKGLTIGDKCDRMIEHIRLGQVLTGAIDL